MKQNILNTISDLCSDFLYYDRKEDESLSVDQLQESVESGIITIDEMVAEFRRHLENSFEDANKKRSIDSVYKEQSDRIKYLESLINSPEINNFIEGFKIESAHQTERWDKDKEEMKPPHHYILVYNKLLGKLSIAIFDRDIEKFKHHLITLAASGYNCFRQIEKEGTEVNRWFKPLNKDGKRKL